MSDQKMGPVAATTKALPKTLEAIDTTPIANRSDEDNQFVAYRSADGATWSYRGKRGRVLAMLANMRGGVTQWDTLPWHTRLGGTIHALRQDGLNISTEIIGRYRHARYRLATPGSLLIQRKNREGGE